MNATRRPGRPPRLSREQVVGAALELVDRRGLEGLTMRALARELGVDPMAVYRHVRDKDDLLGEMCDALLAELTPLEPASPWEPQVRRLAHDVRSRLAARPALLPVLARAPVTPASLALARDCIELLARRGFDEALAAQAFGAVFSYVLGHAMVEAGAPPVEDPDALREATLSHLGAAADDPPPHLDAASALMSEAGDFELGLDLLLDGLRARLA